MYRSAAAQGIHALIFSGNARYADNCSMLPVFRKYDGKIDELSDILSAMYGDRSLIRGASTGAGCMPVGLNRPGM
jgi:hypothetical protein